MNNILITIAATMSIALAQIETSLINENYHPVTDLDISLESESTTVTQSVVQITEESWEDINWAIETLLEYIGPLSTEWSTSSTISIFSTPNPAADLRKQADEIEQKDRDIVRARNILKDWKSKKQ